MDEKDCHINKCLAHEGVERDLESIKRVQALREDGLLRLWDSVESKVSIKVFLGALSAAIAVLGVVLSLFFYSQNQILSSIGSTQIKVLDQMITLKVDMGVIKYKLNLAPKPTSGDDRH